jgi:hypothetical protein
MARSEESGSERKRIKDAGCNEREAAKTGIVWSTLPSPFTADGIEWI